jgi:hypothetical protein
MLGSIRSGLEIAPVMSAGDRRQFVVQTVLADDEGKMGRAPQPMPRWLGNILAWVLEKVPFSCAAAPVNHENLGSTSGSRPSARCFDVAAVLAELCPLLRG